MPDELIQPPFPAPLCHCREEVENLGSLPQEEGRGGEK